MRTPVLVLNPNATKSMTQRVAAQLRDRLGARFEVREQTAVDGPPVIDTPETFAVGALAAQHALQQHLAAQPDTRAVLLACFGDPGLEALREAAGGRAVHGLAHAAMTQAAASKQRVAIVTCGPAWAGMLHDRVLGFGLEEWLAGVWTLPVNGRELALEPARWQPAIQAATEAAEHAGAQALILGGAAFAGLGPLVRTRLPSIDAVDAAAEAIERDQVRR